MYAREPASAGKRGSRRHYTMSFNEKVVVVRTSYQMLEVLASGENITSFTKDNNANFSSEKW